MALTLVTGRAGCGKTGTAYDALLESVRKGRPALLLLPSRPDVDRAVVELAEKTACGIRMSQFDRYLDDLWSIHGDGRTIVGPLQRELLVGHILEKGMGLPPAGPGGLAKLVASVAAAGVRPSSDDEFGPALERSLAAYRARLKDRGLVERTDAHAWVAGLVPEDVERTIAVHRFTALSAPQLEFVESASRSGRDVWVTMTWEEEFPPTAGLAPLVERLRITGVELEMGSQSRHFTSPEIARMEARLFQGPDPQPSLGHVTLLLSSGDEAEAEAIARVVSRWLAESIPAERIAVIFRSPGRRLAELRASFRRAGIDADFDVPVPFGRTSFGRGLGQLSEALLGKTPAHALAAFLLGPYSGLAEAQAAALDRQWRRTRPGSIEDLIADLQAKDRAAGSLVSEAREFFCGPVGAREAGGWAGLLDRMLVNAHRAGAAGEESFGAHSAGLRAIEEAARSGERVPGQAFLEMLRRTTVPAPHSERRGRVQVLAASRARSRRFDAVVLGGLTAGEFPASLEEGSAPEGASFKLRRLAEGCAGLAEERLLFYQVVSGARSRLALSRQETDAEGTQIPASVFWEEILDLYRDEGDEPGMPPIERVTPADPMTGAGTPRVQEASTRVGARQERLDEAASAAFAERRVWAAGEIEAYVQCPYRWFYARVLRPEKLDAEVGPLESGSLAHAALQRFYEQWAERSGKTRLEPGDERAAEALVAEVFSAEKTRLQARGLSEEHELLKLGRQLRAFVQGECEMLPGYEPRRLEWGFGESDGIDLGGFLLSGRIDRIDVGAEGLVVVDYKRGAVSKVKDFEKYGLMQLQLYACAARLLLKEPVAGGLYRSVRDGDARGFYLKGALSGPRLKRTDAMPGEDIDTLLDRAVESASAAVSGMRSGRIPAEPVCEDRCGWCPAYGVCASTAG